MTDRIVFWQNQPSLHFAPLIAELSRRQDLDVAVVAESPLSADRRALGWSVDLDHGDARVVIAPENTERRRAEHDLGHGAFNIFSGLGTYPKTTRSMLAVQRYGSRTNAVFSEPWNPHGVKGRLRGIRYKRRSRHLAPAFQLMLTTGRLGRAQFEGVGIASSLISPFIYTVAVDHAPPDGTRFPLGPQFHVVFVGKLESRKRVDDLLRALAGIKHDEWQLSVLGDGPLRNRLKSAAESLGIAGQTSFLGSLPNSEIRARLSSADLLVLPSAFDGWGAVVNEALHSGVPCLVSDMVGAGALLATEQHGSIFPAGEVSALRRELEKRIQSGRMSAQRRSSLSSWAARSIAPPVVGDYLIRNLRGGHELHQPPPWESS